MSWVAVGSAVAGAAVSSTMNNRAAKKASSTPSTSRVELDPRMQEILYGTGQQVLRPGLTTQMGPGSAEDYRRMLNNDHIKKFGIDIPSDQASQDWLTNAINEHMAAGTPVQLNPESDYMADSGIIGRISGLLDQPQKAGMANLGLQTDNFLNTDGFKTLQGALGAATGLQNSTVQAPVRGQASEVNAPNQNALNLAPAYQDMVYGAPGSNPFLISAIQRGINQSTNAFQDQLSNVTRNLTENVLPSIRGGARVSGSYGSNRESLAQGKALDSFNTQVGQALQRFGQGNTDAAVTAQAGAYDTDRNRTLSAMSGLGAQQYGVASQDAQMRQQQNLANQQAELATNELNAANRRAGVGLSSGLLGQMYGFGTNADAYAGNKVGQVAGLLQPFTGLGASQTQTQPLYSNSGANILGGAMLGQQLAKGFSGGNSYNNWLGNNAGLMNSQGLSPYDIQSSF